MRTCLAVDPGSVRGAVVVVEQTVEGCRALYVAEWVRRKRKAGTVWEVTSRAISALAHKATKSTLVQAIQIAVPTPSFAALHVLEGLAPYRRNGLVRLAESAGIVRGILGDDLLRPRSSEWRKAFSITERHGAKACALAAQRLAPRLVRGLGEDPSEHVCEAALMALWGIRVTDWGGR